MKAWLIEIERVTESRDNPRPEIYAYVVATRNGSSPPRPGRPPYWLITDEDFNRLVGDDE